MRLWTIAAALWMLCAADSVAWQVAPRASTAQTNPAEQQAAFAANSARGLLAAERDGNFLGARSCAAAACHGNIAPDPRSPRSRRHEFVFWLDRDPHARAYRTVTNAESTQILRRLEILGDDGALRNAAGLANCFGCHNPQPPAERQDGTFFTRDGVSCEMCHGPAEQWIGPHVAEDWEDQKRRGLTDKLGFVDTKDTWVRARTCVACHVGSPGREVNHDLIAAGHPVLKFEMTAYHDLLPKHWRDQEARQSDPDLELKLWSAGQVAAAEAALELLAGRAQRAADKQTDAIWPELAEYDCYGCHHDLAHPSWRQDVAAPDRPLGMPAWGTWYFSQLRSAENETLRPLVAEMQRSFGNDPATVQQAVTKVQIDRSELEQQMRDRNFSIAAPDSWDEATQRYLALVAAKQAFQDRTHRSVAAIATAISELRGQLAFPPGFNGPQGLFASGHPQRSRAAIEKSLAALVEELQRLQSE